MSEPTPAAMRAAKAVERAELVRKRSRLGHRLPTVDRATIVDSETALPELVEAIERAIVVWGKRDVFLLPEERQALTALRAALAAYEKGGAG
jgi:hypothetical protein